MRNTGKATTLESKFPLLAVEQNCIISKDADITACFRVHLPELFTVASAEYDAIHSAWHKAIKTLPDYTIVNKQDWFYRLGGLLNALILIVIGCSQEAPQRARWAITIIIFLLRSTFQGRNRQ